MKERFEDLFSKRLGTIKYDLERVKKAFKHLELSSKLAPSILVAGTNGKGSTSGFLAKLFHTESYRVGLFTSPHLCHFRERIQVSHREVSDEILEKELVCLKEALGFELYEALSFFEVSVLLAFCTFSSLETDLNIIEVGLGGLLDATNIIEPIASVVVSISLDHTSILGESLQKIFEQKLGVARKGRPLFLGMESRERKHLGLEGVLKDKQLELGFQPLEAGKDFALAENSFQSPSIGEKVSFSSFESLDKLPPILKKNFCLALGVYTWYQEKSGKPLNILSLLKKYEKSSFSPPSLQARFQEVFVPLADGTSKQVFMDVCHNEASLRETYNSLEAQHILSRYGKIKVFFSLLNDKPLESMLDYLQGFSEPLVLFSSSSERTFSTGSLKKPEHLKLPFYSSFRSAWESNYGKNDSEAPWLICGSFFAVGDALSSLKKLSL